MHRQVATATVILIAFVGSWAPDTRAEPRPATPWSKGISDAAQQRALQLFQQGNTFLEQKKYTDAIPRYELALRSWDHPNIRFNMAICLINMRQPLTAWEHLTSALRFGDAPLGKRLYTEGMNYQAALEASLAELTVKSSQPEVKIMLDGAQLLAGAGERTTKLLAGRHQLVATRPGYVADTRALDLPAGAPVTAEITLVPEQVRVEVERENYERRWRWWAPWTVAAGSVVIGLAGGFLYQHARNQIKSYDQALIELCMPIGCTDDQIPADLARRRVSAGRNSGIAIGMISAAGVLAITSGVMAILNRPHKIEDRKPMPALTVSRDYVGASISLVFD